MSGIEAHLFCTFWGLDIITKRKLDKLQVATVGNPNMHPWYHYYPLNVIKLRPDRFPKVLFCVGFDPIRSGFTPKSGMYLSGLLRFPYLNDIDYPLLWGGYQAYQRWHPG